MYISSDDETFMWRAIDLAYRAEASSVAPNPRVGAVLVHDRRIIGEGYHKKVGEAHAEVNCLNSVQIHQKKAIKTATLYVTLEPCAHEGRTPSCAKRIVSEGIKKVVIGSVDPNPLVAGKGIRILQEAGVEVQFSRLSSACNKVAEVFMTNHRLQRPFITLKWAESRDKFIDAHEPSPRKISTLATQRLVHQLRSQHTAILVGSRTFQKDNPRLNNREWLPSPYSPRPILLSHQKRTIQKEWLHLTSISHEVLKELLNRHHIYSLLVEGGSQTLTSFLELGLWDVIHLEQSPRLILQGGTPAPALPNNAILEGERWIQGNLLRTYRKGDETY